MAIAPTANGGFVVGGWGAGTAVVAQITEDGQATWVKALPQKSSAVDVAEGPDGKVYFVGQFTNDEIFYTYDPASDTLTPHRTVAGDATTNGLGTTNVAVSTTGAVWISGDFTQTVNLGTGALSAPTWATFLIKFD